MKKLKLTESQIKMLQSKGDKANKTVKISESQYTRIFESMDQPASMSPASKSTKNFKKMSKNIPDSNFKFENDSSEHVSIVDFGEEIKSFLKTLLSNVDNEEVSPIFQRFRFN